MSTCTCPLIASWRAILVPNPRAGEPGQPAELVHGVPIDYALRPGERELTGSDGQPTSARMWAVAPGCPEHGGSNDQEGT